MKNSITLRLTLFTAILLVCFQAAALAQDHAAKIQEVLTLEGDKFMTQATGQPAFEIFAESETVFYPRAFPAKLTFIKDADGKVNSIRIDQAGRVTNGKRIK